MYSKKEIGLIVILSFVLAGSISFGDSVERLGIVFLSVLIILVSNTFVKKMAAYYYDSEIEMNLWFVQRLGFVEKAKFSKPVPAGIILPLLVSLLTIKKVYWLACMVFDVKAKAHRAAKRHGFYSFSEMTEDHIGIIASSGVAINLVLAIIGYLIGFEEFSRLNIYYAFFNMLPISDLDGNKIFFSGIVRWSFLAVLTLVGLGYTFLVI